MNYNSFDKFIIRIFLFLLSVVLAFFFPLEVFPSGEDDGFFQQINAILSGKINPDGLGTIHYIRYLVIAPFLYFEEQFHFGKNLNTFIILQLIQLCFFAYWKFKRIINPLLLIIILIPIFVSLRTSLLIISAFIVYFYITEQIKSKLLVLLGFFISMLSSGVILNYIVLLSIFLAKGTISRRKKVLIFSLFSIVFIAFIPSVLHKVLFFSGGGGVIAFITNMVSRSNVFSSFLLGNYINLAFYLLFIGLSLLVFYRSSYFDKSVALLFIISALTMEGLGSTSLFPLIVCLVCTKLNFRVLNKNAT
ncbi:hypothetical protein Q4491_00145 [Photobacterium sp. 2_MG-2023]|uniref:hypothetical protein n=1 Tax=Photobacterium sp. 2_MG-2023 TaxID=3062663 RepID=UPI0026E1D5CF|nr:hypothetical protein [Photobacterium sp. 2_MG-2023]MDO6579740.1 hypothetical protein [Photobacterium sp. 2_MG-2023]